MNATMKLSMSSILLVLAGGLAAYAPAASAQVAPLKNVGNSRCLAVSSTGAGITQVCAGTAIQRWTQTAVSGGFLLRNGATGLCLNNSGGTSVITSACNAGVASQRWARQNVTATSARFRSASGLYLDSTSVGAVSAAPFNGSSLQIWQF